MTIFDDRSHLNWRSLRGKKGKLFMDVYSAWPRKTEVMVGTAPELRGRVGYTDYQILVDETVVASNQFSPWILGRDDIDISLKHGKVLTLKTHVEDRRGHSIPGSGGFVNGRVDGLFWGGGMIETAAGKTITLSDLEKAGKLTYDGIRRKTDAGEPIASGMDYQGGEVKIQGRLFKETLPAQPRGKGLITVDLTGLEPVRLKISIGADYPYGIRDLKYQRRVYSSRVKGKTARFLTLIEPYEKEPVVRKVTAPSADKLLVELADGTVQEIDIFGFEGEIPLLRVDLTEFKEGLLSHIESTID